MLVIRRLFGTGTNCIAPSGLPLLLCLFPGLAPWAFLSRPCGASFAPETRLDSHCAIWSAAACCRSRACGNVPSSLKRKQACALQRKAAKRNLVVFVVAWARALPRRHADAKNQINGESHSL